MPLYDIGLFDFHLIRGRLSGGADANTASILPSLMKEYKVLYFPRSEILYNLSEAERCTLLDKLKIMEGNGLNVSETFKKVISRKSNFGFLSYKNARNILLSGYSSEAQNARILYDNDFNSIWYPYPLYDGDIFEVSCRSGVNKIGVTLRGTNTINLENHLKIMKIIFANERLGGNISSIKRYLELFITPYHMDYQISRMKKNPKLRFIGVVNKMYMNIFESFKPKRYDIRFYYLHPSDETIFPVNLHNKKADDRIFYFARLVPEKGIFEIPYIALSLKHMRLNFKFRIAGQFTFEPDRNAFFNLIRKLGVEDVVEYLGFLPLEDLHKELANSKIFVYPSHSDTFSIAVIQALSQGIAVVAYDIPMLRSMYENIKPVVFVDEYNTEEMAKKIAYFLVHNEERESLFDSASKDFIDLHSSRTRVFKRIKEMIDRELTSL